MKYEKHEVTFIQQQKGWKEEKKNGKENENSNINYAVKINIYDKTFDQTCNKQNKTVK